VTSGIRLPAALVESIRAHGEETYPHECCGFLLGSTQAGVPTVSESRRAGNRREDSPQNRYLIAPEEFLETDRAARREGLDIVGFYHSHPDVPAVPSEYDREHAWPWYCYVIVPVASGRAGAPRAWVLRDPDRVFDEVDLREAAE
jgi:proteasome lid subunit RPN8/RPN11